MPKYVKILITLLVLGLMVFLVTRRTSIEPINQQTNNYNLSPITSTTLFFAGDIMLSRNVHDKMEKVSDFTLPFRQVADEIRQADIAFANLESPFNDSGRHFIPNSLVFNADPQSIAGLNFAGFDLLSTANNHSLDQGVYGLTYTYNWLVSHDILPVGSGNPKLDVTSAVVEKNKINFGFLAYTYTAHNNGSNDSSPSLGNFNDLNQLKQDILTLKGHYSDVVIVNMHAGTEYTQTPTPKQIEFAHAAIDAGADLVIGEHPHWIQTIEEYKGKWIFYSLGNFVFDQMWSQATREGLTLLVTYEHKHLPDLTNATAGEDKLEIIKIELKPVIIENYSTPRWANSDETQTILAKLGLTSAILFSQN